MKRHRNRSGSRRRLFESVVRGWNSRRRIFFARRMAAPALGSAILFGTLATAARGSGPLVQAPSLESSEGAARAQDTVLDEVVVTGEQQKKPASPKYTEPLRNIPQTITIIPQEVIEEQGAASLRDVLRNVPGISMQAGEGGVPLGDNLSLRGFSARTDLFVDGVRDFGGYTRDPFNFEQVEVVKGPASSYAGRGSTGGAINLATKSPRLDAFRDVSLGGGSDSYKRGTIDMNQPLALKGAALRLNGLWHDADTPGRGPAENKRWGIAPALSFGLDSPTRVTLYYSHLEQDNLPDYGIPWVPQTNNALAGYRNQPPPVNFDNFYGLTGRDYEETKTDLGTVVFERDFGSAVTLRNLARYGQTDRDSVVTAPRFASDNSTAINRNLQERDQEDGIFANQLDVTSKFNTGGVGHAVVTGVEVARETFDRTNRTAPTAPQADLFNPNPDQPYSGSLSPTGASTETEADSLAFYVFDTMKLGEQWQFNAGFRWDSLDADQVSVSTSGVSTSLSRKDNMPSWRAGLVFKPLPDASVYVGYGTSFNPAAEGLSLSSVGANAANASVDPEENRTYEIGTKWGVLGGRMSFDTAFFRTDKVNARTEDPTDPNDIIVLEGEQRVEGVELAASGNITDRWSLIAAATFLKSEVRKDKNPAEQGLELANTPKQSYNLWTTYRLPFNIEIGGGAQFVGKRFNSTTIASRRQAPSYWLFDAMAAYKVNENLSLRLNGYNLGDKDYIDRVGGGHFIPGPGRNVTLATDIRF